METLRENILFVCMCLDRPVLLSITHVSIYTNWYSYIYIYIYWLFFDWYVLVVFRVTCAHALWHVGQRCMDLENHATMFAIHVWTRQCIMVSRYTP